MIRRTALPGILPRGVRESLPIADLRLRPLPRQSPDELDRLRKLFRGYQDTRRPRHEAEATILISGATR